MTTRGACPLAEVACCREVPEYHEPVPRSRAPFEPGDVLDDRFLILDTLSRSGMGTVFKAEDLQDQRRLVAVKMPHPESESDPEFLARFQCEERIGLELHHPFILKFLPVQRKPDRPYLVAEYLRGCTLAHLLQAMRPLPEKDALKIASLICEALQYLHEHGVIHRDLKPQNVMICCDGTLRLMDFGIARKLATRRLTLAGPDTSLGTPEYMAPEQVMGKGGDARTDLYNLGAVLYEMLTGSIPFPGENACAAMHARVTTDPRAPRLINPQLSPQAEEIVLRALQREPAQRYPTAAVMKADLDRPEQLQLTGLGQRLTSPGAPPRRRAWLAATAAGPIATGLLLLGFLWVRHHFGS